MRQLATCYVRFATAVIIITIELNEYKFFGGQ